MKRLILGLVLMVGCQALADMEVEQPVCTDASFWCSRVVSSGSQIAAAWMLPNYGVGADLKFGLYFSAGLEHPWKTACVLVPIGLWGADPVALSTAFSLFNRGLAITTLHEGLGFHKSVAFLGVAWVDGMVGHLPGLEKFKDSKWMGAIGNSLEHFAGPLTGGLTLAVIPLKGLIGETAASEFSEESGMRVTPAIFDWAVTPGSMEHTTSSAVLAASSFWASYHLKANHRLKSSWMGAAGMSFMINVLVFASQWLHQTLDA